ncbi:MAG: 50S ribosomal protein L11 methyltransferase [Prevotella sp.]|uniref:50S ribosomal protein L11 methyltransferase n=1 Tax=Prevotella sp. TaxID=59823 RepID=UPI0025E7C6F2|nr:50S ribosomal protein L11 methyltransferase [uncultured Prevotella sp.]MED9898121.1 50S ribosomal protein L11 methyltransferase [Prevotella sp.]HRM57058.1 50S ribosomal protein L11 methyltransferase [Prevotella sp.]
MKYLVAKFKIATSEDLLQVCKDLLADSAAEAGFESFEETQEGLEAYVQKELFDKDALDASIADFPIEGTDISYTIEDAEDKDWNEEWEEQGFDPICVDDQVLIYDAKHPELHPTTSPDHIEIGIEAKLAFGTGNHETTRMIVSTLLNMNLYKMRVLDCGCGTGILGLVASKLGASEVVGYDIDEWSVENAKHNAQLNGVDNLEVYFGNASVINHISGVFDVVLANINRNILLEDMKSFRGVLNEGGYMILSGFYEEDIPVLLEKAKEFGLYESGRRTDNNWACLVLKNK